MKGMQLPIEKKRILVVDDEPAIAESVAHKIGRLKETPPYGVETCTSARQALALTGQTHYEAVVTDVRMPFLTGCSLVKELRVSGFSGVILVLSGYDDFTYVRECFVNGADDYMLKPVSAKELGEKLSLLLEKKGLKERSAQDLDHAINRNDIVSYAKAYIRQNYKNSSLSMETVANHVAVSYSYFSSLFRRETGETFPAYLRKLRIEKAIELLEDPGLKISDICYQVGFKYPQQFSNDFKKVTGVYPSRYTGNE